MTCIATDGKTMAGDGLITGGALIIGTKGIKVRRLPDGTLVGLAGQWAGCELTFKWFEDGEKPDHIPDLPRGKDDDTALEALILRPDGRVQLMDDLFAPYQIDAPAAIGAGSEVALGLMLAGKTPVEAVSEVSARITTVGGKITEEERKGARS